MQSLPNVSVAYMFKNEKEKEKERIKGREWTLVQMDFFNTSMSIVSHVLVFQTLHLEVNHITSTTSGV